MTQINTELLQRFIDRKIIISFKDDLELTKPLLQELEDNFPHLHWIAGQKPTKWYPSPRNSQYMYITTDMGRDRLALTDTPEFFSQKEVVSIIDLFDQYAANCQSLLELLD